VLSVSRIHVRLMLSLTSFSIFRRAPPWSPTCSGCPAIFRRRPLPTLPCRAPTAVGRLPLGPRAPRPASLLRLRAASAAAHGRLATAIGAGRAGPAIPRCRGPALPLSRRCAAGRPASPSRAPPCPARVQQQQFPHGCVREDHKVQDDVFTVLPPIVNPLPFHRLNSVSSDSSCIRFMSSCST
jgi:hypothetical protein